MLVSLFNVELNIDKEYIPLINDIIRMFIIQIVAHALFVVNNKNVGFFDANFLQMLVFILLGIATYWMVVRKIVIIN
jgi:hypothetical protein